MASATRSKAWIYYAILTVIAIIAAFSTRGVTLVPAAICAAYAAYLYRGGRFVIWFW